MALDFRFYSTQEAQDVAFSVPYDLLSSVTDWLQKILDGIITLNSLWQVIAIVAATVFGFILARFPSKRLKLAAAARANPDLLFRMYQSLARVAWPVLIVILLWCATITFSAYGMQNDGLRIAASLLNAWIVVRVITSNMRDGIWQKLLAFATWVIAALYILRLLDPVTQSLDGIAFEVGGARFSVLRIITSVLIAWFALWAGGVAGNAAQTQLRATKSLTPSMAGLLGQVVKIGLMIVAGIIALHTVGFNLTALTVFSGAIGIGVGFGLQAIFSNFASGIIILLEQTITVGDFIELQSGVTGEVREINIRSTLVTTNDNVDILVPNEEFIKAQVINWTLKESSRRLHIPFGVAYGTKKETVRKAGLEAAKSVRWTYDDGAQRAPQVWLVGFGDSSIDYELVVWLTEEAVKRPGRVTAEYNWEIHTALEKYELEIPFPQRDLHVKSTEPIRVRVESSDDN